ncbi:hypothetical protein SBA4_3550038 [Candidatus Sulfopaludibacter sp. SbA4]|nr:hypothetical protein SBA4_3550038 [Candidatus Sulfopaludibacter sp. SbA4]
MEKLKNLEDGYKWAKETVQALKAGNLAAVDMDALVDEIESVYTGLERQLEEYLEDLLKGKLRLRYTATDRKESESLVAGALVQLSILFRTAPSIRDALSDQVIDEAYQWVRQNVERDSGTPLPERCPYSRDDLLTSIQTLEMDDVEV